MECHVLCCDYDGTIADEGTLGPHLIDALERLRKSGRKTVLVTGRQLDDLIAVCPRIDLFERVVAENGALLYEPASRTTKLLAEPPPPEFVRRLRARIAPLWVGRSIIATSEPHEITVLETIREMSLEWQVIFNKGAVMVLPAGVNKATGLAAALKDLGISPRNALGIGDAENDHALLSFCEWGVAVANAVSMLKERADVVTHGQASAGVCEIIDEILETDLATRDEAIKRHHIVLGRDASNRDITVSPHRFNTLVLGSSGGGKSTLTTGLLERLSGQGYRYCVIDPEGDYELLEGAVVVGTPEHAPDVLELARVLATLEANTVVSLVGVALEERPKVFQSLIHCLERSRRESGIPHWVIIDEAHHVLPVEADAGSTPAVLQNVLRVTVHPQTLAPEALKDVRLVIAVGDRAHERLHELSAVLGRPLTSPTAELSKHEGWLWRLDSQAAPERIQLIASSTEHRRHTRKYAEGELPEDRSFYFRGPQKRLNLRAQNLTLFVQLADGIDDDTWNHHLRQHDYSTWIREALQDVELAEAVRTVEDEPNAGGQESKKKIRELIEQRYTAPASV